MEPSLACLSSLGGGENQSTDDNVLQTLFKTILDGLNGGHLTNLFNIYHQLTNE
jgi:hypothetical protein